MYASLITILAAASAFVPLGRAAPSDFKGKSRILTVVKFLDSKRKVNLTDTDGDGGRRAKIPMNLIASAPRGSAMLATREGSSVGDFTSFGKIENTVASYACRDSGEYAISDTIEKLAVTACKNFLEDIPGVPTAQNIWNIWQSPPKAGADGSQVIALFRWYYNSVGSPPLTLKACKAVYHKLTSDFRQGGDGDSQGREIKLGSDEDYTQIGYDPNEA